MKKLFTLTLLFVLFASVSTFAQDKKINFSVSPSLALPSGRFSDVLSIGGDLEVKGEYPLTENVNFTGAVGFGLFSYKNSGGGSTTFIPAIVGLNYNLEKLQVGFGVGYVSYKFGSSSSSNGGFTLRPQVGFDLTDKVQLNLNYTSTTIEGINVNYIGISPVIKF